MGRDNFLKSTGHSFCRMAETSISNRGADNGAEVKVDLESKIQRTSGVLYGDPLYGMRVNHGRPDIAMPQ